MKRIIPTSLLLLGGLVCSEAESLVVTVASPPLSPSADGFKMGTARRPDGSTLALDSQSLLLNGKPWTPVMGEFHFSRYPANEWREELLKMKSGGIDIVATYVFWIHHEESEGQFDWSERRDLRRFVQLCDEAGLKTIIRCGPWCHGEVRNGGQPDWLLKKGWKLRSDDPNYLARTKILYGEIAKQLAGLLWKDGGPVIGIQLENEFHGPAQHLLTLKQIGREAGLDVPLYTRTGWPELSTPMPFGEIAPLYGVYAEGFWDRELTAMPGRYWAGFHFSTMRTDANIADEVLGRNAKDSADVARYPYLTCEIGGGMASSYHRRILVNPADIDSTTLVKLGSGSTSPGYYMYHGGVNPEGKLSTLQESQASGYWNDLPVKTYDFQAPLGEYGQVRPQYHSLRRLHLFLHEWGASLARMNVALPERRPDGKNDTNTLRWCARSDGQSGFVFVNNTERLRELPSKTNVQFTIKLPTNSLTFPKQPVTIPSGARCILPFNLDLGKGVKLDWATAQPICAIDDGDTRTVFFAAIHGVTPEFAFDKHGAKVAMLNGKLSSDEERTFVTESTPNRKDILEATAPDGGKVQIVLLDEADSLALWKANWAGRDRVFLTRASLTTEGEHLRQVSSDPDELALSVVPQPKNIRSGNVFPGTRNDGVFMRVAQTAPKRSERKATFESVQPVGRPREIPLGKISKPVAAAPEDADFDQAGVWRIKLPRDLDLSTDPILCLNYVGDVARVVLNGKLLTDDFYNGNPLEIGLRRHAPEILSGELRVQILPLRRDAPIYLPESARPKFGEATSVAELRGVEIVPRYSAELIAK